MTSRNSFFLSKITGALCAISLVILLFFSSETSRLTFEGLKLCASSIIPSLFVYMIVSDMLISCGDFPLIEKVLGRPFQSVFGIPKSCVLPFTLGFLCGFPIGGKYVCDLYASGRISKRDAEYALAICNNTGPAFIISGIGASMMNSAGIGVLLYATQFLATFTTGILFKHLYMRTVRAPIEYNSITQISTKNRNNLTNSIGSSAHKLISICGCVIFFSVISGIINAAIRHPLLRCLNSVALEIGSAAKYISNLSTVPPSTRFSFIAAAVSFSGVSVYMQTKIFVAPLGLSMKIYVIEKAVAGILAFVIGGFLYSYVFMLIM